MDFLSKIQQLQRLKGTEEGFFILLEALKEHDFRVRKVALEGLLQSYPRDRLIRHLIGLLYIEDNASARNTAIEALIAIGPQALKALEGAFETDNDDVRKFIVDIAGQMKTAMSVPLLLRAIQDEDENVRAAAVEYLGQLKAKEVVAPLVRMLQEEDLWVRYSVIEALGMIGSEDSLPVIIKALQDRTLSEVALRALSNFEAPELIDQIVPYLRDRRRSVSSQAMITLSKMVHSEKEVKRVLRQVDSGALLDMLRGAIRSNDPELKKGGIRLMGYLGGPEDIGILLDIAMEEEMAPFVEEALRRLGQRFPHVIESYLWKGYPEKRRFVARVMASLKNPIFYGSFMKALSEVDGHVVAISAKALSEMGDRQSLERLIPLLGHPFPDVQEAVVGAIVRLGRYLQTEELRTLMHSPSEVTRANAVLVAGRLRKEELLQELGLLTVDPSSLVRKATAEALGEIGTEEALHLLRRCLIDEEPDVRIAGLSSLKGPACRVLMEEIKTLLWDPVSSVRVSAIRAFSRIKTRESLSMLRQLLSEKDPYIVVYVIEALKDDPSPQTTEAIKGLLNHPDREVRRTVIENLGMRSMEETIKPYLLSEDWAIRLAAVRALSRYPTLSSRKALKDLYQVEEDSLVRETIKEALDASG